MSNDRSGRTLLAATLLLAAVLIGMNRAVVSAPLGDWWLPILLAVIGLGLVLYRPRTRIETPVITTQTRNREYLPTSEPLVASPETAMIPEQIASAEVTTPDSPETAEADTPAAATPAAPVTAADAPAPPEYARTEQIVEKDAPPAPPPDESQEASAKTAPEEQVVLEATADPAQPYETEKTGDVTPEAAAQVAEGRGEETHIAKNLTEPASPQVSQQETSQAPAGTANDLTVIDGIGPKSAAALRAAGVDSFQKLANMSEAQIIEILRAAKVRIVGGAATWAQQAAYAAQGDWDGFNRFIQEYKSRGGD